MTDTPNPPLVEATRGDMVESRHRASYAVVGADDKVLLSAGDIEGPVYGRSAIKALQAIPLVETGAAEAFGLGDREIALACASHNGEPMHSETVTAWLERVGLSVDDLECGAHLPYHEASMIALLRKGGEASAAHNNCSGKHSGFLTTAVHMDWETKGYINFAHPVQQRILGTLETMTGISLGGAPRGIDGCGIPVIGMPLANMALAMARMADPVDLSEDRKAAAGRICRAIAAEPLMIGGTDTFDSKMIAATGGKALVKTGAEGVHCAILPEMGIGIAMKVDDGNGRASCVVMGQLLRRLDVIDDEQAESLAALLCPPILNRAGKTVGGLRPAAAARF